MLSQEELEKIYQENFPVGMSLETAAERLAAMDVDYVNDIRKYFATTCSTPLHRITLNMLSLIFPRMTVSAFSAKMWRSCQRKTIISTL